MLVFTNLCLIEFELRYLALFLFFSVTDGLIDLPDGVIYDIAIYSDDTTLYSKCDQASDL